MIDNGKAGIFLISIIIWGALTDFSAPGRLSGVIGGVILSILAAGIFRGQFRVKSLKIRRLRFVFLLLEHAFVGAVSSGIRGFTRACRIENGSTWSMREIEISLKGTGPLILLTGLINLTLPAVALKHADAFLYIHAVESSEKEYKFLIGKIKVYEDLLSEIFN